MKNVTPDLDKRKAFILATVVYEYIATGEPVGSNTLTQKYNVGVSSATIRNEMAELEAGGYLVQPHTSAGRIPSDAGYRTYVDQLMSPETLAADEQWRIKDEFRRASRELGEVIEHTTRLLSQLSQNLAFVLAPLRDAQTFRHIQLIWLSTQTGLAVIVTSLGVASQTLFEFLEQVSADDLTRLSNRLNSTLGGLHLRDITLDFIGAAVREAGLDEGLAREIERVFHTASSTPEPAISASGAQHLLDKPEFQDLRKLRAILRIVEEQKSLYDLVADSIHTSGTTVKIGHELGSDEITECSIVTVPYEGGEGVGGVLAILGPRRMPYGRLMALAAGTAESLSAHLAGTELR
ncbi:MAG: heat-inducible transcription repressor HrcA [Candidatus Eremiobacteraeota bacterium]|nr:heat-inducible transcription repressor HrcA [Candidatus Eremiobacteraeota bacterium]MBV9646525.1 heat-inducible transcription repressor HrcA [Candidatus Eremiobacteraeota bacterium]